MGKQRVLHVAHLKGSGIGTVVMNLYRNINRDKIAFDFWVEGKPNSEDFFEKEAIELGAKIYKYSASNNVILKHIVRMKSLYGTIKNNEYSVVHIHASDSICMEYAVIAKIAGVRSVVVHSHNSFIPRDEKRQKIKVILHKIIKPLWWVFADYFIAVSKDAGEWMFTKKVICGKKYQLIKNGIDLEKYRFWPEKRVEWRQSLGIEEGIFVLGNVGRLVEQKNPLFMIEILKEVKRINPNSILLLVGRDGTQREAMDNLIEKYGLVNDVVFLGESNKVEELLQAMDFFVFPSYFEGLGVVAVEAQATGLPVIASMGVPDDARACGNFYRVDLSEGATFWAEKILDIFGEYKRCETYEKVKQSGYGIKECAANLEQIYRQI